MADDPSADAPSLTHLFHSTESLHHSLLTSPPPPNSPELHTAITTLLARYRTLLTHLSSLALFSPNESLDDLPTSSLPYLLIHYHIAELTQRLPSSTASERKGLLGGARGEYERFLHLLDSYDLLSTEHKQLLERYTDDKENFAVVGESDMGKRREGKIKNLKEEKALKARLEYLRARPGYGKDGEGDEELVRETHLSNLRYHVHMTFQALEGLSREWDILKHAPDPEVKMGQQRVEEDGRRRGGERKDGYSDQLDAPLGGMRGVMGGPLLNKQGRPLQPFTLVGSRQELGKGVFRPGHNLPTMSIDEYLEEERKRGGIIEGGGEKSGQRPVVDEDDYEKADEETMKARAWDDFTESNHKGSGNTMNRG